MESLASAIVGLTVGVALIAVFAATFPFVDSKSSEQQGTVWMAYHPKQCQAAPWDSIDQTNMPSYDDYDGWLRAVGYLAEKYYMAQGITVYNYTVIGGGIVPAMCGYNTSHIVYLQVSSANIFRLQAMGLTQENPRT